MTTPKLKSVVISANVHALLDRVRSYMGKRSYKDTVEALIGEKYTMILKEDLELAGKPRLKQFQPHECGCDERWCLICNPIPEAASAE